jgi:hypothetical protein
LPHHQNSAVIELLGQAARPDWALVGICAIVGLVDAILAALRQEVDRTLIRESLALSVDERFQRLADLQRFAEELRRAGGISANSRP